MNHNQQKGRQSPPFFCVLSAPCGPFSGNHTPFVAIDDVVNGDEADDDRII